MTKYGDISPRTAGYAVKRMLKRAQTVTVTERFGQVDPQGKNKTKTRKYRRYLSLAPATAPLAEGVTPQASNLTYQDVVLTLEQFGAWTKITDVVADTHEDDVLKEMSDLAGEQQGDTVELIRLAVLKAGTNVSYAGGVSSRSAVVTAVSITDIRRIVRGMRRARARTFSKLIKASPNYGTEPVAPSYFALGHTDLQADLESVTGFTPVEKYANTTTVMEGEVGKVNSIRFILTDMVTPWLKAGASSSTDFLSDGYAISSAAALDVYPIIVLARDGYGIVPLSGTGAVSPFVKNPTQDKSDPLGQWGFVSWKTMQGCVILNHSWIHRLEVACTAL